MLPPNTPFPNIERVERPGCLTRQLRHANQTTRTFNSLSSPHPESKAKDPSEAGARVHRFAEIPRSARNDSADASARSPFQSFTPNVCAKLA